ncbi:hypothetical protein ACHQM5_030177 [Ranunculus cassubicifolius]
MSFLHNLIRSKSFLNLKSNQTPAIFSRLSHPHFFSTAGNQQNQPPPPTTDSSVDAFLKNIQPGVIYGRLTGTGMHTLKMDVITFLEGCNLSPQDVKVAYGRFFETRGMVLQFHSKNAFDNALRTVINKNRSYRLEKVDRSAWETPSYDGKSVMLTGIPLKALIEDIERFLSGTDYISSRMELLTRDKGKIAVVQYPTAVQASNAVLAKNRSFCLNNQIQMRLIQ